MIVIGIDCGLDGGVVGIAADGLLISAITPTLGTGRRSYDIQQMNGTLLEMLELDLDRMAFLERAQAMPGQGVSSTFSIGLGFGLWQGLLTALRIPFEIVSPRLWQNPMFIGVNRKDTKAASALVAQRLRPDVDWRASPRCRNPHDGLTDAFCIAEYGRRRLRGLPGELPMLAG